MAPRGPAKTRDYDYSNVGKAGRRTGVTLKEGKLDEHGMEEIDGIFSSPEKSPEGAYGNNTTIGSDGMSMDEGNGLGPADFLNGTNGGRASFLPPPVARSPMKSGLSGSPRRTPGLRSSASPQRDSLSSSPSDGKGLGSAKGETRRDVSPLTNRSINAPSLNHVNGLRNNKGINKTAETTVTVDFSDSDANSQMNGDENANAFEQMRNNYDDSFNAGDDTLAEDQQDEFERIDGVDVDISSYTAAGSRKTERSRAVPKTKKLAQSEKSRAQEVTQQNETSEQGNVQKRKRPGRPPKSQRRNSDDEDTVGQRPSKKSKTASQTGRGLKSSGNPELDKVVENYVNRTGPLKGRSLYILKREIPTDGSATHTRSGRVSVRPLAYWKNERCVYGDGEAAEGQRYPLSTIKEIIRTEELEPEKRKVSKRRSSKKSKSRKSRDDDSDNEDDDYVDPWEKEGGVLHGYVRKWDPDTQAGSIEEEVLDIAYAPSGIETRDVKDSTFRFAKLLSSPFIGSGIVELPPGGVKKPKNSKKMHMVFYVCHGRVQVDISGVQFSAGKGCVFQVPRGNYYSFANTHGKDARLFFTQGCVPVENDQSSPGSASKPAVTTEDESTTQMGRPNGTGKGRPKGKQKAGSGSKAS
ncbi:hypothetical protein Aspvir_006687 [Aspergillus viridinutans]|uniref:CENP-C homolog n=1 Tax=Aspergillus viridinutans TaxID=75553 RepID=A0A9P3BZV8_ASPVI|nr:uncharacterized protein Aspvir_006687 [Aspergillus viridinutans]GIK02631.1 hypothetical protein Aspvir_006687 [Aspergillus viridinutans]